MDRNNKEKKNIFVSKRRETEELPDENTELFERLVMERRLSAEHSSGRSRVSKYVSSPERREIADTVAEHAEAVNSEPEAVKKTEFIQYTEMLSTNTPREKYIPPQVIIYKSSVNAAQPIQKASTAEAAEEFRSNPVLLQSSTIRESAQPAFDTEPAVQPEVGTPDEPRYAAKHLKPQPEVQNEPFEEPAAEDDEEIIDNAEANEDSFVLIDVRASSDIPQAERKQYAPVYEANQTSMPAFEKTETKRAETPEYLYNSYNSSKRIAPEPDLPDNKADDCEADYDENETDYDEQLSEASSDGFVAPSNLAIIAAASLAASLLCFALFLNQFKAMPTLVFVAVLLLVTIPCGVAVFLLWNKQNRGRFISGAATFAFLMLLLIVGCAVLGQKQSSKPAESANSIDNKAVTEPVGKTDICVYLKSDSTVTSLSGVADGVFGILKTEDRNETNEALKIIAYEVQSSIHVAEYDTVEQLLTALSRGDIKAAVADPQRIEAYSESGNPELVAEAKELCICSVDKYA